MFLVSEIHIIIIIWATLLFIFLLLQGASALVLKSWRVLTETQGSLGASESHATGKIIPKDLDTKLDQLLQYIDIEYSDR